MQRVENVLCSRWQVGKNCGRLPESFRLVLMALYYCRMDNMLPTIKDRSWLDVVKWRE